MATGKTITLFLVDGTPDGLLTWGKHEGSRLHFSPPHLNDHKQDHFFTSPSTAASIVMGRNANGRVEWKDADGTTLKENEER